MKKKILETNYLDVLFAGRNKIYGAYILRKKYSKRILFSLSISILFALFISILIFPKKNNKTKNFSSIEVILNDIQLEEPEPLVLEPPAPSPKKIEIPKQAVKKFTTPKVVPNKEIKKEETLPKQEDLKNQTIGIKNEEGEKGKQLTGNSDSAEGMGNENGNGPLTYVDIIANYPGNWHEFLNRNLEYPQDAQEEGIGGKVKVSFIVDIDGSISDIKILSGPQELREECIRVIKSSGKWEPARKNGIKVKYPRIQDITFQLD